jgi:putative DNA primase/helicase
MPIRVDNIPKELIKVNQWVGWREIKVQGGLSKIPINPYTFKFAKVNDSTTWGNFYVTLDGVISKKVDGMGFVFSDLDPYIGIDLDDCFSENGKMLPETNRIVNVLDSYTELSPSMQGLHIIVKAPGKDSKKHLPPMKKKGLEIYPRKRFFTITSMLLPGSEPKIAERYVEISRYIKDYDRAAKIANPIEKLIPRNLDDCPLCLEFKRSGKHAKACPRSTEYNI